MKLIRKKEIIKYAVVLVIFFLTLFFVFLPRFNFIRKTAKEFRTQKTELDNKYKNITNLGKMLEEYHTTKDKLPRFEEIFVKEGEELKFITQLEALAENNRITQEINLSPNFEKLGENIKKVPFNLKLSGEFNDLLSYLNALTDLNFQLSVQSLDLKKSNDQSLALDIGGYTYWFIPETKP